MEVDIYNQHVYYYENNELIYDCSCVTGTEGYSSTPSGIFSVEEKIRGEVVRECIDPVRACTFFVRPDDPLFRVKQVYDDGEETQIVYFPYAAEAIFGDDQSVYVKEYHDYYW